MFDWLRRQMTPRPWTKAEVAALIRRFLDKRDDDWEWDDFISIRIRGNDELERIRKAIAALPDRHPPDKANEWCSDGGKNELREVLAELEGEQSA